MPGPRLLARRRSLLAGALTVLALVVTLVPVTAGAAAPAGPAAAAAADRAPVVNERKLAQRIKAYVAGREGSAAVAFRDLTTGQSYTYRPRVRFATASVVKVDVLATLLLQHQRAGTSLTKQEWRLASRMIRLSDNAATDLLWARIGGWKALDRANARFGLVATSAPPTADRWGGTRTTAADQVRLIRMLTRADSVLDRKARRYVLGLMRHVTGSQRWGVPAAADDGTRAANKNGWAPQYDDDGRWEINSVGRVRIEGRLVAVAILTRGNPSMRYGTVTATRLARIVGRALRAAD